MACDCGTPWTILLLFFIYAACQSDPQQGKSLMMRYLAYNTEIHSSAFVEMFILRRQINSGPFRILRQNEGFERGVHGVDSKDTNED